MFFILTLIEKWAKVFIIEMKTCENPTSYCCLKTEYYWITVFFNINNIIKLSITRQELNNIDLKKIDCPEKLNNKMTKYFFGNPVRFDDLNINISSYTEFEQKVLNKTRKIPFSKIISYSELANSIGYPKAVRAVANSLAKNRIPIIIPCHRIIRKNGQPGGFTYGLEIKKFLLKLESSG